MRHIDWNVTARLDEPYVRQYTEDRELTAWLLLDRSRVDGVRHAGAGQGRRADRARRHAGPAPGPRRQPSRRVALRRAAGADGAGAHGPQPRAAPGPRAVPATSRRGADRSRRPTCRASCTWRCRRSVGARLVFLVSDFLTEPGWERPLGRLAERHEVVAVRLVDPLERELPEVGLIVVEDAETGEQVVADTSDPEFRRRYHARGRRPRAGAAGVGPACRGAAQRHLDR